VIGQYGGKEFRITYDGVNPSKEIDIWYKAIIDASDRLKAKNNPRSSSDSSQRQEVKEVITETTTTTVEDRPATTVTQQVTYSQPTPSPVVPQPAPIIPQPIPVQPPPVQYIATQPQPVVIRTPTYVPQPQPVIITNTLPPVQPVQVTYTSPGFSPYQQTLTTTTLNRQVVCVMCRSSFNTDTPGNLVRCPYCHTVNTVPASVQQTTTIQYAQPQPYTTTYFHY